MHLGWAFLCEFCLGVCELFWGLGASVALASVDHMVMLVRLGSRHSFRWRSYVSSESPAAPPWQRPRLPEGPRLHQFETLQACNYHGHEGLMNRLSAPRRSRDDTLTLATAQGGCGQKPTGAPGGTPRRGQAQCNSGLKKREDVTIAQLSVYVARRMVCRFMHLGILVRVFLGGLQVFLGLGRKRCFSVGGSHGHAGASWLKA